MWFEVQILRDNLLYVFLADRQVGVELLLGRVTLLGLAHALHLQYVLLVLEVIHLRRLSDHQVWDYLLDMLHCLGSIT